MSHCRLRSISTALNYFPQLQQLNLSHNNLHELSGGVFNNLPQLQNLKLSHNNLNRLFASLCNLPQLQQLDLSHNNLNGLSEDLRNLPLLERLDLSYNNLTEIPVGLSHLPLLQRLNLSHNRINRLCANLSNLQQLQLLNLSHNNLTRLSIELDTLLQLQQLDLSYNSLVELPVSLRNLHNLRRLCLRSCNLNRDSLRADSHRTETYNNRLDSIVETINSLHQLVELDVLNNSLLTSIHALERLNRENLHLTPVLESSGRAQNRNERNIAASHSASHSHYHNEAFRNKTNKWRRHANANNNINHETLSGSEKSSIHQWLKHLEKTVDFARERHQLSKKVWKILTDLTNEKHSEYKSLFFETLDDNLTRCGDRAAMSFNLLFTSWKVHCTELGDTTTEKLESLAGLARTGLLREEINHQLNHAVTAGLLEQENLNESVEAFIYWETKLKSELKLETAINHTKHRGIAKNYPIDEKSLKERVNSEFLNEMASMDIVKALWKKDGREDFTKINRLEDLIAEFYNNLFASSFTSSECTALAEEINTIIGALANVKSLWQIDEAIKPKTLDTLEERLSALNSGLLNNTFNEGKSVELSNLLKDLYCQAESALIVKWIKENLPPNEIEPAKPKKIRGKTQH